MFAPFKLIKLYVCLPFPRIYNIICLPLKYKLSVLFMLYFCCNNFVCCSWIKFLPRSLLVLHMRSYEFKLGHCGSGSIFAIKFKRNPYILHGIYKITRNYVHTPLYIPMLLECGNRI